MKKFIHLSNDDLEHLIVTIETSLSIKKRFQFFLWAQGALQGFLPHETLLCVHGDIARMRFRHETFSANVLSPEEESQIGDPVNGLLPRIVDEWLRGGGVPQMFSPDGEGQVGRRQLFSDLKRCKFGHVAAQGAKEMRGEFGSFFVFVRMAGPPGAREAYLLDLLMPYLHMALHRMLANEQNGKTAEVVTETRLSKREIQVLHWVKNGKTNQEIGQILDLSPLTVKNHVQKIMRKLNVSNRAQAVGKSATLRMVAPGESV